jgi:hypothetical protein
MMKLPVTGICALTFVCLLSVPRPAQAQTAVTAKVAGPFAYDLSKEVTFKGTVASVLTKASAGMIPGSHLLLTTLFGRADISLGVFGLRGKGALSVEAGQQVEVTGVMKTFQSGQIFLARTVKVGNQIYAIRNEHGVPVSPQGRERITQKSAKKDETL